MPLQATSGAASYDAFGGGVAAVPNYIEEVFSTWLYTGNGSTQTINNGIDLAGKGGLVWLKSRSNATNNYVYDTDRGLNRLITNTTNGGFPLTDGLSAFNANGFSLGNDATAGQVNVSGNTYASWTFREQPKFFDVVTYTGDGGARNIAHNLGSVPGCIIIKRTDASADWVMYHRSTGNTQGLYLNTTDAAITSSTFWENTTPTSTTFRVGVASRVNAAGGTYVAYLFAHNAGGFGLTGTDNVISCGSYTGNGSATGPVVTLGYEPQWLLVKQASSTGNWFLTDTMRGFSQTSDQFLLANSSGAEFTRTNYVNPLATGFQIATADFDLNESGGTFIYIAIRRGPMKVPTTGTSVYNPVLASATAPTFRSSNFTGGIDSALVFYKPGYDDGTNAYANWQSRLTGTGQLQTPNTRAEISQSYNLWDYMNGQNNTSGLGTDWGAWLFKRAPGFFDVVCYTGNFTNRTIAHNLAAVPELMIIKNRSAADRWSVYSVTVGPTGLLVLNTTAAADTAPGRGAYWNSTAPTASVFSVGQDGDVNNTGSNYVNYLFASCPGVSKVGSFTGTGATQVINCGFTGGARFVLIKATSTTGNWLVWDSARGIVSGNDPYLALNSTAAEVTNTDWVDTAATGFELSNAVGNLANSNGVNYIFLAIA